MVTSLSVVIRGGRLDSAGTCIVCGDAVPAGSGFAARCGDRVLRFKCADCLARFEADPQRYLAGPQRSCCDGEHEQSPPSEWRCD